MCSFISRFLFIHFVIFLSTPYPPATSFIKQFSNKESNNPNNRLERSVNNDVLWNTEPPTVVQELPISIAFYSDEVLSLQCNIKGNPIPTYQWYLSTNDLSDRSLSIQDEKFDKIVSATEKSLIIDGKETTKNYFKHIYFCSAHNPLGTLYSNKIIVEKVKKPKSIEVRYTLDAVYTNQKFVAKCFLVPDLAPLFKFKRWEVRFKSGKVINLNKTVDRYSVIHSTKYPQLHIRNVTNEDFKSTAIRCLFQSTIDKGYDLNNVDFRQFEKFTYEDIPYFTKLSCNGETVTASVGSNIELPWCSVPRTLEVSWYKIVNSDLKNRVEIGNHENNKKFVMVSRLYGNLMIMNVTKEDAGKYMVGSNDKRLETIFTLNVYEIPTITLTPKDIRKKMSESAEFTCRATFTKCQFRWLHNGLRVVSGYDDGNVDVYSTETKSVLRVKKTRLSVSGVYQCIASSLDEIRGMTDYRQISGTILLSEVPPVLVKQSPRIELGSSSAHVQMSRKYNFQIIECTFAANPEPHNDWYHDSNKIEIREDFAIIKEKDPNSVYNFVVKLIINLNKTSYYEDIVQYAGEYRATVTNSLGSASCSTFILMDGKLDIRLPSVQTAVGEKDYVMTCYFMAMGIPEFYWDRKVAKSETWETLPVNHRTNLIEKGHKLLLKSVIKNEDEGTYRCTIKYNRETKAVTTRLLVAYPPILKDLPTKHDSSQSQTHICTIRSEADKPWYAWWTFTKYNSNETIVISPQVKNDLITVYYKEPPTSKGIVLSGLPPFLSNYPNLGVDLNVNARSHDKDMFGKFVCHVKNHIGSDEKTIEDNFLRLEFKIIPPSSSEVVVGETLYLDCTAKESDLKPYVRWKLSKDDTEYTDINNFDEYKNRIFQYDNGTLVMRNIKESDPYKMICFIVPSGNSDKVQSKISYIEIRVPARIRQLENNIFKVAGSSFNLSCDVFGHTQNMVVSWYHRSSSIGPWKLVHETCIYSNENPCLNKYKSNSDTFNAINVIHNKTYNTVNLAFHVATESISGQYKCEASNKYNVGHDRSSTTLTIISKPSMVIIDHMPKDSTSTSVRVDWRPPERNGNRPLLRYIIIYHEMSTVKNNAEHRNFTKKTIRVNESVHYLVIENLRPFKKYLVMLEAENEVGFSEPAKVYLVTQEAKPQKPVNNLLASSTKPDEILVSWDDPDTEYQNGRISGYQLCYQIIPPGIDSKAGVAFDSLNWPVNYLEVNLYQNVKCKNTTNKLLAVSHLPQFTDFAVRVIAFNSKGVSPPLYTKVRTLEDLPQAPPSLVTCEGQHQSIELTWNPPGRQTINGVLVGYAVYYYQPNIYSDESGMKSINVQGRMNVVIDQLKPYTPYSIQVMAVNRKGLGPPSGSVVCTTKEAKPEAPESVKAIRINNTCVYVSWLHTFNPNGIIREYCVVALGFVTKAPRCQRPDMNKRYNNMILCESYGGLASVKVFAKNQYDGAMKEALHIDDINSIISFGGDIYVKDGSSVILPCETSSDKYRNIYWKHNGQEIIENIDEKIKLLKNFSIEVSNIERYKRYSFSCSTEMDSIEYRLIVQESTDGIPKIPLIDDYRVTENSIFIRWKSQGTSDVAVPITGFDISWQNLYNGYSKTVNLDAKARSFYLNNVTCASDFIIKVRSQSGNGNSKFSEPKRLRTLGTVPQIPDSAILLPSGNIDAHSANFNLMAFGPGENCSAMFFIIELSLTSMGSDDFTDLIFSKNVSIYELKNKCCYKVTGLNPLTAYKYRVTAFNPAGSTPSYYSIDTLGVNGGLPGYRQHGASTNNFASQSWLLMIVLVIVIILVLIVVVVGVLYILRSKEKKGQPMATKIVNRKADHNQNRIEKVGNHEDTASIDSEPSPYAVYQPDADQKKQMISHQISQQSSNLQYNFPDHHYNQIRYDKVPGRLQMALDNYRGNYRRANSAECLSSLGNASMTGIADLESPSNIEPNNTQEYFRAPFNHCADTDEVFQNIRIQDFSTMNRKRMRRESENTNRYNEEEKARLMNNRSRYYEPNNQRIQHQQQMNPISRNPNQRLTYCQQMSMPEPSTMYQSQHAYPNNRVRTSSGSGRNHPSSQTIQSTNLESSAQVSAYGSYYGHRANNIPPHSSNSVTRRDDPPRNLYSSYVAGSNLSNYNPPQRSVLTRPAMESIDSPDEGIYTDRVIVV